MSKTRGFSFTYNNPPENPEFPPHRHLIYGKEIAPTTGTPHLQGAIYFDSQRTLSAVIKSLPGCHVEAARNYPALVEYCKKEGNYIEDGEAPMDRKQQGKRGREEELNRWDNARKKAREGDLDAIPADIYLRCRHAILAEAVAHQKPPPDADGVCGLWLWGPPGSGKSRRAREDYPGIFDKPCNKWFDSYRSGPILLDDFDTSHRALGHHLKRWADRYAFTGEIKGGTIMIRPERVVVTSNYSIRSIFADDNVLAEALERRFEQIYMPSPDTNFNFPTNK